MLNLHILEPKHAQPVCYNCDPSRWRLLGAMQDRHHRLAIRLVETTRLVCIARLECLYAV